MRWFTYPLVARLAEKGSTEEQGSGKRKAHLEKQAKMGRDVPMRLSILPIASRYGVALFWGCELRTGDP